MKPVTVVEGNALFFLVGVGMCLGTSVFPQVFLEGLLHEETHFPTDITGKPGYIKFDFSAIRDLSEADQKRFVAAVRENIFRRVSHGFHSRLQYDGDYCERVTVALEGYEFAFHIRQYERDSENGFEIVDSDALSDIPEDETLGRVVWLTVKPIE